MEVVDMAFDPSVRVNTKQRIRSPRSQPLKTRWSEPVQPPFHAPTYTQVKMGRLGRQFEHPPCTYARKRAPKRLRTRYA